ncbi:MAG: hypothetical protein AB8H80_18600 [Planctomycetota bacterium]
MKRKAQRVPVASEVPSLQDVGPAVAMAGQSESKDSPMKDSPMKVRVLFFGRAKSRAVANFAVERVEQVLSRFRNRIEEVRVRVRDVNGTRGGEDQQCSLELCLVQGERLHLAELSETPMQALHRLALRARRVLQRRRLRRRRYSR